MTLEELTILTDIMRGRDITQRALAERLVATHRELQDVRQKLSQARRDANRRRGAGGSQAEARIKTLEQRLISKEKALDFSVRRCEVLRGQLSAALGSKASRPKHTIAKRGAE